MHSLLRSPDHPTHSHSTCAFAQPFFYCSLLIFQGAEQESSHCIKGSYTVYSYTFIFPSGVLPKDEAQWVVARTLHLVLVKYRNCFGQSYKPVLHTEMLVEGFCFFYLLFVVLIFVVKLFLL